MKQAFTPPTGAQTTASPKDKVDAVEKKLQEMLLKLPILPKALGNYLPVVKAGHFIYLSGQLPMHDNSLGAFKGRLGREITLDGGQRAAKQCTLNALALVKRELGSLEKIKRVVKLTGFVSGMPGFTEQALVLNGASDLLVELFGEAGKHARSAVGVTDLPLGSCVEIEYVFETK
jgi:enamine deaminase RidA (YjgF/YER057c/UK114 family)